MEHPYHSPQFTNRPRLQQQYESVGVLAHPRGCVPSDIDLILELSHHLLLFEMKYGDAQPPNGQRIMLERVASRRWYPGIVLVAHHSTHDPDSDVIACDSIVREVFYSRGMMHGDFEGQWLTLEDRVSVMPEGSTIKSWAAWAWMVWGTP